LVPLLGFLLSRRGQCTGLYYIDSTALAVCHNRRIGRHKTFAGMAARGKTSMGWFFGFKLHLVFNHLNEIVAVKLTPGNVHDGAQVEQLTRHLTGKLFGDQGLSRQTARGGPAQTGSGAADQSAQEHESLTGDADR
jgi:hypothetical protein